MGDFEKSKGFDFLDKLFFFLQISAGPFYPISEINYISTFVW